MAGSLNHIVTPDGGFSMGLIDHLGDAEEALEECFDIIAVLICDLPPGRLQQVCRGLRFPEPHTPIPGKRSDWPREE